MKFASPIFLIFAMATVACACNIPVFRYALERWRPDKCEVIVFHDGTLTPAQLELLEGFGAADDGGNAQVNLIRSDVTDESARDSDLWTAIKLKSDDASLPYVVVRTKLGHGQVINGWHGPLERGRLSSVLDSPVRKELGRRLLAGHSIVWLVIGSGDEKKNEAARKLLQNNFDLLSDAIELPEGIGLPGSELHSEVPLLLRFSLLEVDRDDLREEFLVRFLSGFQGEAVLEGEPLIIPVFGRGRALEVIPASDLSPRLMEDLTIFLSSACSCQVKEQNPGFDLVIAVDWDKELFGEGVMPPPAKTTRDREKPVLLTIPPGR